MDTPVRLVAKSDVPIACTLDAGALPDRLDEWNEVLSAATTRARVDESRVRIGLTSSVDPAALATLVASERECCAFLGFAITLDDRGLGLEVTAPPDAQAVLESLFTPTR